MALTKYKLGELIEPRDVRNSDGAYTLDDIKGISTEKEFTTTKANMDGVSLSSYKIVDCREFAYVADTSRRRDKIAIAFNTDRKPVLISPIYTVFRVAKRDALLSEYLFIFFNRSEFDRYARFNSWGSARETFDWAAMCDITIELPDLPTQQKYVDIYNVMTAKQQSYERELKDLKLVCDGLIENLRQKALCEKIGSYLVESDQRNTAGLPVEAVRGIATSKELIPTKANMDGVCLDNYKVVEPGQIAYVADTSRRGEKISLGFNDTQERLLVSPISTVFGTRKEKLLPEYLMLFFVREEFDRYARFHSWGSARETFDWSEMCNVEIPIPDIDRQKAIAKMYTAYVTRTKINEKWKTQIKDICPVLIRGSLEGGK